MCVYIYIYKSIAVLSCCWIYFSKNLLIFSFFFLLIFIVNRKLKEIQEHVRILQNKNRFLNKEVKRLAISRRQEQMKFTDQYEWVEIKAYLLVEKILVFEYRKTKMNSS